MMKSNWENSTTLGHHLMTFAAENAPDSRLQPRIVAGVVVISLIVPLVVAGQLQPSPSGLGTHQQLGLPPCTMRVLWDLRCPACGMTTSWSHFVRGEWLSSLIVNIGGFLLAMYALVVLALAGTTLISGRLPAVWIQQWLSFSLLGIAAVTVADWARRVIMERLF